MLIAFSGKKGAGKDTCAAILEKMVQTEGKQTFVVGLADPMKVILGMIFSVNPDLFYKNKDEPCAELNGMVPRDILISFAKWARNLKDDVWVSHMLRGLEKFGENRINIVTDVRHGIEYDAVRARSGIIIRIVRTGTENEDDISETALDGHEFDYVIHNNGSLIDLVEKVMLVWQSIKNKEVEYELSFC